ncbi:hypothetical protein DIPPA_23373 [Diplonema papillatum]|nr:hypothetical protein DIPPA_23373 [Diplonema papillatum]
MPTTASAPSKKVVNLVVALVGSEAGRVLRKHWPHDKQGMLLAIKAKGGAASLPRAEWFELNSICGTQVPHPGGAAADGRAERGGGGGGGGGVAKEAAQSLAALGVVQKELSARELRVAAEGRALLGLKAELDLHERRLQEKEDDLNRREQTLAAQPASPPEAASAAAVVTKREAAHAASLLTGTPVESIPDTALHKVQLYLSDLLARRGTSQAGSPSGWAEERDALRAEVDSAQKSRVDLEAELEAVLTDRAEARGLLRDAAERIAGLQAAAAEERAGAAEQVAALQASRAHLQAELDSALQELATRSPNLSASTDSTAHQQRQDRSEDAAGPSAREAALEQALATLQHQVKEDATTGPSAREAALEQALATLQHQAEENAATGPSAREAALEQALATLQHQAEEDILAETTRTRQMEERLASLQQTARADAEAAETRIVDLTAQLRDAVGAKSAAVEASRVDLEELAGELHALRKQLRGMERERDDAAAREEEARARNEALLARCAAAEEDRDRLREVVDQLEEDLLTISTERDQVVALSTELERKHQLERTHHEEQLQRSLQTSEDFVVLVTASCDDLQNAISAAVDATTAPLQPFHHQTSPFQPAHPFSTPPCAQPIPATPLHQVGTLPPHQHHQHQLHTPAQAVYSPDRAEFPTPVATTPVAHYRGAVDDPFRTPVHPSPQQHRQYSPAASSASHHQQYHRQHQGPEPPGLEASRNASDDAQFVGDAGGSEGVPQRRTAVERCLRGVRSAVERLSSASRGKRAEWEAAKRLQARLEEELAAAGRHAADLAAARADLIQRVSDAADSERAARDDHRSLLSEMSSVQQDRIKTQHAYTEATRVLESLSLDLSRACRDRDALQAALLASEAERSRLHTLAVELQALAEPKPGSSRPFSAQRGSQDLTGHEAVLLGWDDNARSSHSKATGQPADGVARERDELRSQVEVLQATVDRLAAALQEIAGRPAPQQQGPGNPRGAGGQQQLLRSLGDFSGDGRETPGGTPGPLFTPLASFGCSEQVGMPEEPAGGVLDATACTVAQDAPPAVLQPYWARYTQFPGPDSSASCAGSRAESEELPPQRVPLAKPLAEELYSVHQDVDYSALLELFHEAPAHYAPVPQVRWVRTTAAASETETQPLRRHPTLFHNDPTTRSAIAVLQSICAPFIDDSRPHGSPVSMAAQAYPSPLSSVSPASRLKPVFSQDASTTSCSPRPARSLDTPESRRAGAVWQPAEGAACPKSLSTCSSTFQQRKAPVGGPRADAAASPVSVRNEPADDGQDTATSPISALQTLFASVSARGRDAATSPVPCAPGNKTPFGVAAQQRMDTTTSPMSTQNADFDTLSTRGRDTALSPVPLGLGCKMPGKDTTTSPMTVQSAGFDTSSTRGRQRGTDAGTSPVSALDVHRGRDTATSPMQWGPSAAQQGTDTATSPLSAFRGGFDPFFEQTTFGTVRRDTATSPLSPVPQGNKPAQRPRPPAPAGLVPVELYNRAASPALSPRWTVSPQTTPHSMLPPDAVHPHSPPFSSASVRPAGPSFSPAKHPLDRRTPSPQKPLSGEYSSVFIPKAQSPARVKSPLAASSPRAHSSSPQSPSSPDPCVFPQARAPATFRQEHDLHPAAPPSPCDQAQPPPVFSPPPRQAADPFSTIRALEARLADVVQEKNALSRTLKAHLTRAAQAVPGGMSSPMEERPVHAEVAADRTPHEKEEPCRKAGVAVAGGEEGAAGELCRAVGMLVQLRRLHQEAADKAAEAESRHGQAAFKAATLEDELFKVTERLQLEQGRTNRLVAELAEARKQLESSTVSNLQREADDLREDLRQAKRASSQRDAEHDEERAKWAGHRRDFERRLAESSTRRDALAKDRDDLRARCQSHEDSAARLQRTLLEADAAAFPDPAAPSASPRDHGAAGHVQSLVEQLLADKDALAARLRGCSTELETKEMLLEKTGRRARKQVEETGELDDEILRLRADSRLAVQAARDLEAAVLEVTGPGPGDPHALLRGWAETRRGELAQAVRAREAAEAELKSVLSDLSAAEAANACLRRDCDGAKRAYAAAAAEVDALQAAHVALQRAFNEAQIGEYRDREELREQEGRLAETRALLQRHCAREAELEDRLRQAVSDVHARAEREDILLQKVSRLERGLSDLHTVHDEPAETRAQAALQEERSKRKEAERLMAESETEHAKQSVVTAVKFMAALVQRETMVAQAKMVELDRQHSSQQRRVSPSRQLPMSPAPYYRSGVS